MGYFLENSDIDRVLTQSFLPRLAQASNRPLAMPVLLRGLPRPRAGHLRYTLDPPAAAPVGCRPQGPQVCGGNPRALGSGATTSVPRGVVEGPASLPSGGADGTDRWGVSLDTASNGEVTLAGVLRDMALYEEAVRLVREVPEVKAVRGTVEVPDVGTAPIVHSDSVCVQVEIQQKLRSRGLLRESEADRWGVTVGVNPEGGQARP